MKPLSADQILQHAPNLRLQLQADGTVEITLADDRRCMGGPHAVTIIATFAQPVTFRAALQQLGARVAGSAAWVELADTIRAFAAAGVLIDPSAQTARTETGIRNFGGAAVHARMLGDRVRTSALIKAIQATVRPGDVVVEIGSGTGVLAVAAAQAGARHVYAIEAGAMAPVARELARANGVADRVTVLQGWSTTLTLPERGDVFISETIGNAAFDENILGLTRDALRRHLKPGAPMIPGSLRLLALPVQAPAEWLEIQRFDGEQTRRWQAWYGIDFSPLAALPPRYSVPTHLTYPTKANWPVLGDPVPLVEATFAGQMALRATGLNPCVVNVAGELNAFVLFFETTLAPEIELSTDPRLPREKIPTHWGNPVWLVPPSTVAPGDKRRLEFAWQGHPPHVWQLLPEDQS